MKIHSPSDAWSRITIVSILGFRNAHNRYLENYNFIWREMSILFSNYLKSANLILKYCSHDFNPKIKCWLGKLMIKVLDVKLLTRHYRDICSSEIEIPKHRWFPTNECDFRREETKSGKTLRRTRIVNKNPKLR